ncbi:HAD family hydrolase [Streptomyces sp. S.PB5]|uniref:HAD family hydrolase n=1 Tax=Streptomyces sp. S.PB5 TaxID=3020844 RepID=UPI0025B26095|nr:HAD family hydrolase [Streptomyces sp. S.PB5]MDN3026452.1 HAD family hydrolase [Streptomyces sp. S.PB5]
MTAYDVPAAVLFDLDGTLLDTPGAIAGVLHRVLESTGRPDVPEDRVRGTVGKPLVAVFAELTGLPEEHAEVGESVALFRELFRDEVVPKAADLVFPGVPELLGRLREAGLRTAICTSKIRPSALELLQPAGLVDEFDAIVCHGMAPRGKPHPDLALLAAQLLDIAPERCVMVGDAVDDIRMAAAAGMPAIGVSYGVASARQLTESGAAAVAESVAELEQALGRLPLTTPAPS